MRWGLVFAVLVGSACDPQDILFVEAQSSDGDTRFWLAPLGASQAAGRLRLGPDVYADITDARYNLRPRQSLFFFRHDVDVRFGPPFVDIPDGL